MADKMSIDSKPNPPRRDESDDSVDSTPERDQSASVPPGPSAAQDAQQPKRKGGRKPSPAMEAPLPCVTTVPRPIGPGRCRRRRDMPLTAAPGAQIYATSEERKQRNRQAQAAFRERRTEYIKQLEEAIRVHEANLHNMQTAHRTAAEECLMLRYKNSLLERILLEKGIDVQAELHAKTGSPNLAPTHMQQPLVQPPPIQRAMMNRHHQSRKSNSSIAPKTEPGTASLAASLPPHTSPKQRPTTSSQSNSPSDSISMRGSISGLPRQPMPPANANPRPSVMQTGPGGLGPVANGASFYPTPAFQSHIEQLEHEYDGQGDMMDDSELETPGGPGPYTGGFNGDSQQTMLLSPTSTAAGHHLSQPHEPNHQASVPNHHVYPSMTQLLDQNLDWDPFGLSASMAFPSHQPFHFDQANMR